MDNATLVDIMDSLDRGTNIFGALSADVRARLFAVLDNPTDSTWDDAHTVMVNADRFMTLWQATIRFGGYTVQSKPADGPWPEIPTREQLITALRDATV